MDKKDDESSGRKKQCSSDLSLECHKIDLNTDTQSNNDNDNHNDNEKHNNNLHKQQHKSNDQHDNNYCSKQISERKLSKKLSKEEQSIENLLASEAALVACKSNVSKDSSSNLCASSRNNSSLIDRKNDNNSDGNKSSIRIFNNTKHSQNNNHSNNTNVVNFQCFSESSAQTTLHQKINFANDNNNLNSNSLSNYCLPSNKKQATNWQELIKVSPMQSQSKQQGSSPTSFSSAHQSNILHNANGSDFENPNYNNHQSNNNNNDSNAQVQFIYSLTGRRNFLRSITTEPLTFLAILSLFIEFPVIQDLIYTKVCLETVANNNNTLIGSNSLNLNQKINQSNPTINIELSNITIVPTINSSHEFEYGDGSSQHPNFSSPYNSSSQTLPSNNSVTDNVPDLSIITEQLAPEGKIQNFSNLVAQVQAQLTASSSSSQQKQESNTGKNATLLKMCTKNSGNEITDKELRNKIDNSYLDFWLRYQMTICFICMLTIPYWGGLSDRIGRIIPLCAPIVTALCGNILSIVYTIIIKMDLQHMIAVEWFYLGAIFIGLSGGQAVLMVNSFSFISDHSTSENRSLRVTILEAIIFAAHSIGLYMSKYYLSITSVNEQQEPWLNRHSYAFFACAFFNIVALLYAVIWLRRIKFHKFINNFEREQQEILNYSTAQLSSATSFTQVNDEHNLRSTTVTPIHSMSNINDAQDKECSSVSSIKQSNSPVLSVSQQRLNTSNFNSNLALNSPACDDEEKHYSTSKITAILTPITYYKQTYMTVVQKRPTRSMIIVLLLCGFISALALTIQISLVYSYLRRIPFIWDTSQYSLWSAMGSLSKGIALIMLSIYIRFVDFWTIPDSIVSAIGFLSKGAGLLMMALAEDSSLIQWSLYASVLSEFTLPPIRSLLSKLVIREEIGKLFSCLAAGQSICLSVSTLIFYLSHKHSSSELISTLQMVSTQDSSMSFFRLSFMIVSIFQFVAASVLLILHKTLNKRILAN